MKADPARVPLRHLVHARSGDKGDRLNICAFTYERRTWEILGPQLTEDRVLTLFRHRGATRVKRYDLPHLHGWNFVIDDVLQGGVNGALNLDGHGKTLSFLLLELEVSVPAAWIGGTLPGKQPLAKDADDVEC